jgi:hypothetical protein
MDAVVRPFQTGEGVTFWATVLVGGYRGRRWSGVACVLLGVPRLRLDRH